MKVELMLEDIIDDHPFGIYDVTVTSSPKNSPKVIRTNVKPFLEDAPTPTSPKSPKLQSSPRLQISTSHPLIKSTSDPGSSPGGTRLGPRRSNFTNDAIEEICLEEIVLNISIPRAIEKTLNGMNYISFEILVEKSQGSTYKIERRFADFALLSEHLRKRYLLSIQFPNTKMVDNPNTTQIEQRRFALEKYLQEILDESPQIVETSTELARFLDTKQYTYNPDTTSTNSSPTISRNSSPNSLSATANGSITINIIEARNLIIAGKKEYNFAIFCNFLLEKASKIQNLSSAFQTPTVYGTVSPVWNFQRKIVVSTIRQKITFKLKNENSIAFDHLVGVAEVDLSSLAFDSLYHAWVTLKDDKQNSKGELHIAINFEEDPKSKQRAPGTPKSPKSPKSLSNSFLSDSLS